MGNLEREAKALSDQLLRAVGLRPQLGVQHDIQMQMEEGGEVTGHVESPGGAFWVPDKRMTGVPSGTLLPTIANIRYRGAPAVVNPETWHFGGYVTRMAEREEAKLFGLGRPGGRYFWVEIPAVLKKPVIVPASDIELTYTPIDWGNRKRHRCK